MRRLSLLLAAAVSVLVPFGSAAFAAFFPRQGRLFPIWFWVLWLLVSVWVTFYAPVIVDHLTAPNARSYSCTVYARWGIVLGLINLVWSIFEIVWLG